MAATEASAAPVVQEDGKTPETKPAEAEQPAKTANSETVKSEAVDKDGTAVNSEAVDNQETVVNSEEVDNQETVNNDTGGASAEKAGGEEEGEEAAPPQSSENTSSSAEPKTSFLDSFLNKSGLGKVMAGRKKKEHGTAAGGAEEASAEGGEKEGEKGGEEAEGGAEGGVEGEATTDKSAENGEKEEDKKSKPADTKATVRDLIRKPVARIFSHRSTEKKDGAAAEPEKQVKVRSRSLDRLEDPEALNTTADSTAEEGGAAGAVEGEQKTSSSTKHMKRWHSFKKLMAQKAHKKSGGGGSSEDGKEDGVEGEGGGGDSSTLDSKESGHKRWKLKRSWTFQGLKRDSSVVGISGKAKTSDKESADKAEEGAGGGEEEEGEAKAEAGGEESKMEGEEEKAEGGEEEKVGGGTVTQHANEIWTSFKKRVIHKSKRANTECAPTGEEDTTTAAASGEKSRSKTSKNVFPTGVPSEHLLCGAPRIMRST